MTNTNYYIMTESGRLKYINLKYKGANKDCFRNIGTAITYIEKNKIKGHILSDGGYVVYVKNYKDKSGIRIK